MASNRLPIPAPPRTPTPPTPIHDGDQEGEGLGKDGGGRTVRSTLIFDSAALDPTALSPWSGTFPSSGGGHFGAMNSTMNSPTSTIGELRTDGSLGPPPTGGRNPFNFQTQTISDTPVATKSVCQTISTSAVPLICLQIPPPVFEQTEENRSPASRSNPQTPLRGRCHDGSDGKYEAGDLLSSKLCARSGNTSKRNGYVKESNYQLSPFGSHVPDGDCAVTRRRQDLANLTPPTLSHPYRFPTINPNKQNMGQRRGHRYKHSSVSTQHQIFLEPPPRAPLALPASLPVPNYSETWKSLSRTQIRRICWCLCHFIIAGVVHHSGDGSAALTALSHLIFFDAASATVCVAVDISHNFEVWKRSSIRHPFGLARAEVVAGFAMSIFLLFMGFDLISHNLKHFLEGLGTHQPHHPHSHQRVAAGEVDLAALLSIAGTSISAFWMGNHDRIGRAMRFTWLQRLPSILSNPSHFLTLFCSFLMLVLPLLSIRMYSWLDRLLCAAIACSMFFLGLQSAMAQGLMLLMSYNGNGVTEVIRDIGREPSVSSVDEARFWQVHYGLAMANLKLRVKGFGGGPAEEAAMINLRKRVTQLVRNRLGGGYGKGEGLNWEVTVQLDVDTH